ncbi:hypothetical protein [Paracoccus phage vB_PmaS-R3]|uniref:Uncharacterized protein n=1 Tax=Paracoccus phage vB_PmaS-R3 TaxID=2494563 RepID=A0A0B5A2I8_9CAUD|nr:hypothetical protein VC48_gp29 [Paracoccus phage vB_PmaS-R3]AJD83153.1 hypothetical protein [Paracoccus phage vB_PmaS-R3]
MPAKDVHTHDVRNTFAARYDHGAGRSEVVTPDDDNDLNYVSRKLYIGRASIDPAQDGALDPSAADPDWHSWMQGAGAYGFITVVHADGSEARYVVPRDGFVLEVRAARVKRTGTTAGEIVSWY